jgi:hypothetical protein
MARGFSMARFTQQYIIPVLQGTIEAEKVLEYSVEDAVYTFCDELGRNLNISTHVLHKEAKKFLEDFKGDVNSSGLMQCKGRTVKNTKCTFRPMWHGYCKKHECQYDDKVREKERLAKRNENTIVHKGHGPQDGFVEGCPGCEKKKKLLFLQEQQQQ